MGDKNYDVRDQTTIVDGNIISGYASDSAVNITFNSDHYTFQPGIDGEITRSRTNDNSATITVSLMQTSESNKIFSDLAKKDKESNSGRFTYETTDINGNNFFSNNCTLQKSADIDYQGEAQTRSWILHAPQLEYENVGGGI